MKLSAHQHARQLYGDALKSLVGYRRAKHRLEEIVARAERSATRDARVDPSSPEFDKLIEQIADRDPEALEATIVAARYRDETAMFALVYLMESDYVFRTEPFGAYADAASETRGA